MGIPSMGDGEGVQHLAHKIFAFMGCFDGAHALIDIDFSMQSIHNLCYACKETKIVVLQLHHGQSPKLVDLDSQVLLPC